MRMAWQVLLVRLPASRLDELPRDFEPPCIGAPDEVAEWLAHAATRALVPFERHDPRWVVMRTEELVIEAELRGPGEVIDHVVLHVLGSDAAVPLALSLARALDASAIDCETDMVLDAGAVPDTFRQWQIRIEELR